MASDADADCRYVHDEIPDALLSLDVGTTSCGLLTVALDAQGAAS